ncbi:MAG: hypothetical protein ACXV2E_00960 [Halobacteriota archaeon]
MRAAQRPKTSLNDKKTERSDYMSTSNADFNAPADAHDAQDESCLQLDSDESQPYYIVSDVHLGADECCRPEFEDFIDWLAKGVRTKRPLEVQPLCGNQATLTPPGTLILLGDMLELWAPKGNERNSVIQDSLRVFGKLIDLECHKVYVLGNHDMMLCGGHEFGIDKVHDSRGKVPKLFDLLCENTSHFEIYSRHYPCKGETRHAQPLLLGRASPSYLFVHGHQFDPSFQRAGISIRAVPLIAALSSAFDMIPRLGPLSFAAWAIFIVLFAASMFHAIPVDPLWWGLPVIFFGYPAVSWVVATQMKHVWNAAQRLTSVVKPSSLDEDVPSWPWPMHASSKMRYKSISDFVRDSHYFKLESDDANPDVFVFGHTHVPELCEPLLVDKNDTKKRQFINCGSWLEPPEHMAPQGSSGDDHKDCLDAADAEKGLQHNTFVYVDASGPRLFKWQGRGLPGEKKAKEIAPKGCVSSPAESA